MSQYAPIAVFAFYRPNHTLKTLEALSANPEAKHSTLYIFADGPKKGLSEKKAKKVKELREMIRSRQWCGEVIIRESEDNKGLARSISEGVSEVVALHGKVIVLEDDIVTSPGFLAYMNKGLNLYEEDPKVMHISGYTPDINQKGLPETFFLTFMSCWGWATWADRWAHFDRDPERIDRDWDAQKKLRFNLDGAHDFYDQITGNLDGRIRTWAVFWYATIFENNGWCLTPTQPFLRNIGLDGSGENSGVAPTQRLDIDRAFDGLPDDVGTCPEAVVRISRRLKPRGIRKLASNLSKRLRGAVVDN